MDRYFPYSRLREERGAGPLTALLMAFCTLLAWTFLRLENPSWRSVRKYADYWFPQIASAQRPRLGDPLRYAVQSIWLLLIHHQPKPKAYAVRDAWRSFRAGYRTSAIRLRGYLESVPFRTMDSRPMQRSKHWWNRSSRQQQRLVNVLLGMATLALGIFCITQPFGYMAQLVFVLLLWVVAMLVRHMPGRFPTLLMIILSVLISCRYLWWRYTSTLNWNDWLDLTTGLLLLAAETYAWLILILGYIQSCWPLKRKPVELPKDSSQWPTVDLMIATYNEPLSVVRNTVYAAMGVDWPKDKLRIYLLDDGRREQFRKFAAEVGVGYITRPDNNHAKAGNLNHALTKTDGELIAVFDCDHIPVRSFLQFTVGWFLRDPKMALVQTPHHFLSPDPFERNLNVFRRNPNEGELFYGLVQDGNDMWNATFFCGSCAVLRRKALEEIGGFAVETVTEDAHTALRMHRRGWNSAYVRIPQAAGLATESLSAHIGQRIRWARGMAQIFRIDNPLFGKGLSLFQRICYANAMLHFLAGLPRLIFLLAPLAFLLLHAYIIYAPALMIVLYVIPHMVHSSLTSSRMQGQHRKTFWGEVYETVLAWYIARPTTVALINPSKGKFNVTAKGGLIESNQFDWKIARPYLVLAALNFTGLGFAVWRFIYGPPQEVGTVIITSLWVLYNLLLIGAAVAIAAEVRQVRENHRVQVKLPAALKLGSGHLYPGVLQDYSGGGVGLVLNTSLSLPIGSEVSLLMRRGDQEFTFPGVISRSDARFVGIRFAELSQEQKIDFVQCTFARADAWLNWQLDNGPERPVQSFMDMLRVGAKGYYRLYQFLPAWLRIFIDPILSLLAWIGSFFPRWPTGPAPVTIPTSQQRLATYEPL